MSENNRTKNTIEFTLKAVGDICPGDKSILGLGICSLMKKHGADYPLRNVKGMFVDTDIVIGNLEGLLSRRIEKKKRPDITFCGLPEFAVELKGLGFNVINVANNHILEHGMEMFKETVNILQDAGLKVCGLRDDEGNYYSKPVFVEKRGKRVGILGYNWVGKDKFPDTDNCIAQSHDSVVNYTWNRDKLRDKELRQIAGKRNKNVISDIKKLKTEADYIVLMPHWGFEFVDYPPYGVTVEAKTFVNAGADLILGVHSHVIQGMEQYNEKWIFYSLGNFIFDMRSKRSKNSFILNYNLCSVGSGSYSLDYIRLNKNFQPTKATSGQGKLIAEIIKKSTEKISSEDKETAIDDDKVYKEFEQVYNKERIKIIFYHFKVLPAYPMVIKIIIKKIMGFIELLKLRAGGNKVRW